MKKFVIGMLTGAVLSVATGAAAASPEVKALLFPSKIEIHQGSTMKVLQGNNNVLNVDGSIYIPLRSFAENMGAAVSYQHAEPDSGSLPLVQIRTPSASWKSTFVEKGNMPHSPLSLRLNTVYPNESPDTEGIYAELFNTGDQILHMSEAKIEVQIQKLGGEGAPEVVWKASIPTPDQASPGEWIPGTQNNVVWGIQSPVLYWDKKDMNENPVSPGQYQLSLTDPASVSYNTAFDSNSGPQTQVIEPELSNTIMFNIQ